MDDKDLLVLFIFFVFVVFVMNSFSISGNVVDGEIDVSERFCVDSDKGIRPYTAGIVYSDVGNFNDKCRDNLRQIREYYCTEGPHGGNYKVLSRIVDCGEGFRCVKDYKGKADVCLKS